MSWLCGVVLRHHRHAVKKWPSELQAEPSETCPDATAVPLGPNKINVILLLFVVRRLVFVLGYRFEELRPVGRTVLVDKNASPSV